MNKCKMPLEETINWLERSVARLRRSLAQPDSAGRRQFLRQEAHLLLKRVLELIRAVFKPGL